MAIFNAAGAAGTAGGAGPSTFPVGSAGITFIVNYPGIDGSIFFSFLFVFLQIVKLLKMLTGQQQEISIMSRDQHQPPPTKKPRRLSAVDTTSNSSASRVDNDPRSGPSGSGWQFKAGGSRKKTDLLIDPQGCQYTRHHSQWQCTRTLAKSGNQRTGNRCSQKVIEIEESVDPPRRSYHHDPQTQHGHTVP